MPTGITSWLPPVTASPAILNPLIPPQSPFKTIEGPDGEADQWMLLVCKLEENSQAPLLAIMTCVSQLGSKPTHLDKTPHKLAVKVLGIPPKGIQQVPHRYSHA
ncbi:hypothetical protein EDB87DRAFT_1580409 [Lactarius vividus]|nr:hypothetical protein EDB87DRAFT_1580409 [Lactarius vividus]